MVTKYEEPEEADARADRTAKSEKAKKADEAEKAMNDAIRHGESQAEINRLTRIFQELRFTRR